MMRMRVTLKDWCGSFSAGIGWLFSSILKQSSHISDYLLCLSSNCSDIVICGHAQHKHLCWIAALSCLQIETEARDKHVFQGGACGGCRDPKLAQPLGYKP